MKISNNIPSLNPKALTDILFHKDNRLETFSNLELNQKLETLKRLTVHVKHDLLVQLADQDLVEILEVIDPDEATDILQLVGRKKRERVLPLVSYSIKDSLSTLLEFDPETAAGLMTLDYISVSKQDKVDAVAKKFKKHEKTTGRPPVILVVEEGKLIGFLPGHELGFTPKNQKINRGVKRIQTISYAASHEEVIRLFNAHPHSKVAVLNDAGFVIGIIYSDDVLSIINENQASTLYDFAGVSSEESVTDSSAKKVKFRYKWLIINLATAFLAAFTVSQFEDVISKYVLLAVYMPIVAGMGGNAGTQTLAVIVRGIALKQISLSTALKTLKNEVFAGMANGLINGFLVAFVVLVKDHDAKIAFVLAVAMVINLVIAAFFGTLVPLIMSKLKKDPAASATIFITTATDVLGFLVFLSLATLVLG